MSLIALIFFFIGVYLTGAVFVVTIGCGDPEGRFKFRYAFLWPWYLHRLLKGELP